MSPTNRQLEHPAVMERRLCLDILKDQDAIRGYGRLRLEDGEIRYTLLPKHPINWVKWDYTVAAEAT